MEEDIKVLEEKIKLNRKDFENEGYHCCFDEETMQLVENLIKGYKELEECLKAEEKYAEGLNNDIKSLLNIEPNNNFIPKSKVREKIEAAENKLNDIKTNEGKEIMKAVINLLQELLQEGNDK